MWGQVIGTERSTRCSGLSLVAETTSRRRQGLCLVRSLEQGGHMLGTRGTHSQTSGGWRGLTWAMRGAAWWLSHLSV